MTFKTMFWFFKNDILKILDATQKERETLQNHAIYRSIKSLEHLHISWNPIFLQFGTLCQY